MSRTDGSKNGSKIGSTKDGKKSGKKDRRSRLAAALRVAFGGSIEAYLVKVVIASTLVALVAYAGLSVAVTGLSEDSGLLDSFVVSGFDSARDGLQEAIDDKASGVSDADAIEGWANANGDAFLVVAAPDGDIIYPATIDGSIDSSDAETADYLSSSAEISGEEYDGAETEADGSDYIVAGRAADDEVSYIDYCETHVSLSDGSLAHVYLYGSYSHTFNRMLTAAAVALSVLVFFVCFLLGIRHRMVYVKQLEAEVACMAGGDLTEPITVEGNDEIASLARQIDRMRVTLADQIAIEQQTLAANRDLVTTMSHDLRTPLTSLLLYAQILKDGRYGDDAQMQSYLDKIYERTMHIKKLSDSLFHRFLVGGEDEIDRTESPLGIVMGDLLSGMVCTLEASGFTVEVTGDLAGADWPVDVEQVSRVVDNLLSNLLKYADAAVPIAIAAQCGETACTVCLTNAVAARSAPRESTGIGLGNVRHLMTDLHGTIETDGGTDGTYTTRLTFKM